MDGKTLGNRYVHPVSAEDDRDAAAGSYGETGITLRQHYAGLAMQGGIANGTVVAPEAIARDAVMYADALLAALTEEAK